MKVLLGGAELEMSLDQVAEVRFTWEEQKALRDVAGILSSRGDQGPLEGADLSFVVHQLTMAMAEIVRGRKVRRAQRAR